VAYFRRCLFVFCVYLEGLRPRARHIWYFILYFPLTQVAAKFGLMYDGGRAIGVYLMLAYAFIISSVCLFIPRYFIPKIAVMVNLFYILSREFILIALLCLMYNDIEHSDKLSIFISAGVMESMFYFTLMRIDTVYGKYIGKARVIRLANVHAQSANV